MRAQRTPLAAITVSALTLSPLAIPTASADEQTAKISLSNITDFHGRFEYNEDQKKPQNSIPGAERLKCAIDREAAAFGESHILTSSGDNIGASPFTAMLLDDAPTIDVLNQMDLKVSAVGNHEFDKGAEDLSDRVIPDAQFEYLAANADTVPGTKPYHVEELDGVKVAFIGTVTADMPNLVSPDGIKGITWNDPVATTNTLAKQLKGNGEADVVVALVHAGGINPNQFDEAVDVAFLGHTHEFIGPSSTTKTVVAQAGQYSQAFANVDLSVDRTTKEVTVDEAKVVDNAAILACDTAYPEIGATVAAAKKEADEEGAKVVAKTETAFSRGKDEGAGSGSNRGVESSLNNLLADAAKWSIEANSSITPDIGVMNAGGVREDLPAGDITYQQAFSVQPFGNENTYKTIKGKDFIDALEQQWKTDGDRPRLALGLSNNVSYTYDPSAEQGNRVTSIIINGEQMDPEKDYIIAGSTFLLGGGDSFEAFTRGSAPTNIGLVDVDAFIQYLQNNKDLKPRGQADVAVQLEQPLKPGDTTIELSSLIYTEDNPAKTVTVALEDESGNKLAETSADIDPAYGEKGLGEAGKASVQFQIPGNAPAEARLRITTEQATDVWLPVQISGQDAPGTKDPVKGNPGEGNPGEKHPGKENPGEETPGEKNPSKDRSSELSPAAKGVIGFFGALAAVAAIIGAVSFFKPQFTENIQQQITTRLS